MEDEGFHFSVLSGFRERLIEHGREQVVLDRLLDRLSELGFLRAGGRMRTDATLRDTPRSGSRTVLAGWVQVVMAWMATAGGMRAPSFALSGR